MVELLGIDRRRGGVDKEGGEEMDDSTCGRQRGAAEGDLLEPGNMEERRTALSFILLLEKSLADSLWSLLCRITPPDLSEDCPAPRADWVEGERRMVERSGEVRSG